MAIIWRGTAGEIFNKYLNDAVPSDEVYAGMTLFDAAIKEHSGTLLFLKEGGFMISFEKEDDMLLFLLKFR